MTKTSFRPDYIGIGAMKAASGWIFRSIELHPEVSDNTPKEFYFFNKLYNYEKGIEYYYSIFSQHPPNKIKGEFTPSYMLSPQVASLIHKHLPNVKLIACLRNPADRAYSDYRYNIQEGGRFRIYESFEDTIKKDSDFIDRGFYYKQLKPYFDLFPRENILVVFFEDLKKNPGEFIQGIYKFLGLKDLNFVPSLVNRKRSITGAYIIKNRIPLLNILLYWFNIRLKKESRLRKFIDSSILEKLFFRVQQFNRKQITGKNVKVLSIPPLKQSSRDYLFNTVYKDDIQNLEILLDKDLSFWK